ncbi:MAG: thioredoxin fold domain-containing protein [Candidatus Marinarcus sp.]|uniref:thioredoxin fold domain-containing protein n=1 Tax=Candidatus Marinarcus sp. TaxID=3100987 RepID=UPI003B007D97
MIRVLLLLILLICTQQLNASFKEGKAIFQAKCASCHQGYIALDELKKNFFEEHNKRLHMTIPTENILAYEIMRGHKKIGDRNDPEMQQLEIEEYLKDYMTNPDKSNSIIDPELLKYFENKEPIREHLSEKEWADLATFFMEYEKNAQLTHPKKMKLLNESYDEKALIQEAKKNNKMFLVMASSQTCSFCIKMKKEVLSLNEVQTRMDKNYIFLEVDVDTMKLPFDLKQQFKGMTPTFFVLSKEGIWEKSYPGSWNKADFFEILKENLK